MKFHVVYITLVFFICSASSWQGQDSVLLSDIKTLTLHHNQMTTGRRSSPVPQMKCVGGSASGAYVPPVVQCYNRGSDGYDIQWECKADMDNAFRFGNIAVICEGYSYPEDPYILKGSCGLEYTLEYTKEGFEQQQNTGNYHSNDGYQNYGKSYKQKSKWGNSSWMSDLVMLAIVCGIGYAIYSNCIRTPHDASDRTGPQRPDAPPPYSAGNQGNPPPYGFRQDYMPKDSAAGTSGSYNGSNTHQGTAGGGVGGGTGGGFWTGAGLGGALGYLFGSRTNTGYGNYGYDRRYGGGSWWNRGYGGGWGNTGWGSTGRGWGSGGGGGMFGRSAGTSSWGGGGGGSRSTGTRTASGFGGTRRR